jgi:hypothetical protein
MSRLSVTSALFLSSLVMATSCGKRAEVASSSTTETSTTTAVQTSAPPPVAAAPAPASTTAASSTPIATGNYSGNPAIRADLLEVRRVSGGALLVKWRVVNTSDKPAGYDFNWGDIYYVDPAENKKYGYLTDSEGNKILDVWYGTLQPGEQRGNWAKFPAPPPTSNKISISLPKFPPFEDAPVS